MVAVILCSSLCLYAVGVARLWRHAGAGQGIRYAQALAFIGGWFALVAALVWLDELSEQLFSAHMAQHELLMLAAAPLIAAAAPLIALLWVLPRRPADLFAARLVPALRIDRLALRHDAARGSAAGGAADVGARQPRVHRRRVVLLRRLDPRVGAPRADLRDPMKNLSKIGLGILTSVGGYLEVGSVGTALQAGARFRYELLWALLIGTVRS